MMVTEIPLSAAQRVFWVGQNLASASPLYNMAWRFDLHLGLDPDRFARAFQDVVEASDIMRARIKDRDDGPVQFVGEVAPFPDFVETSDPSAQIEAMIEEPFDLSQGNYRTALFRLSADHWVWAFVQHHIACDAQSGAVLARQVSDRYEGSAARLPSYFERIKPAAGFERSDTHMPPFPYGARRGSNPSSARLDVTFDPCLVNALAERPEFRLFTPDLSRYALYLTLYAAFIARVSGENSVVVGTPSHNRLSPDDRDSLGLFAEVLPMELTVDEADSFLTLHGSVKTALGEFLKTAKPGAVAEARTGFSYVLNYIQAKFDGFAGAPLKMSWIHPGAHDPGHGLRLHVTDYEGTGASNLAFDVNAAVLEETDEVVRHFECFTNSVLADLDMPLSTAPLTDTPMVLRGAARPPSPSVLEQFRSQVRQNPNAVALVQGAETLSYGVLSEMAARCAGTLQETGVTPGQSVVVHMARSIDYVVACLGCMMAGGIFVPVAASNPAARAIEIAKLAGSVAAIVDDVRIGVFKEIPALKARSGTTAMEPVQLEPDATAYVIFTSGSTGKPKGVTVGHDGLARYITWAAQAFGGPDWPLFTSVSFDLTITSLFVPLTQGGRLAVYPEVENGPDLAVLDVFAEDQVDTVKLTPAHLSLVCQAGTRVRKISTLVLGGENLTTGLCRRAQKLGAFEILNEYGPTEAIVGCMIHRFDATDSNVSVPIGKASDDIEITVCDTAGHPLPHGITGEIRIAGRLAKGYTDPDLTARRFVCGQYLTGDLGRLRPDGVLEYLGRADQQIKQGGVRVEPAEVENALLAIPEVQAAFVGQVHAPAAQQHCVRCGLSDEFPGVHFDDAGLCEICAEYENYKDRAQVYFPPEPELLAKLSVAKEAKTGKYDAIMLLSGGKDSTYAAYRLAELTGDVLALTLNNGFISDEALANIKRVTDHLGWDHEFMTTSAMNEIFVDSLKRHSNVCQGCFKTVYTLALRVARAHGVPAIVTGLSRGQFFETRLTPELFRDREPSKQELEDMVLDARRRYHAENDAIAKHLATEDISQGEFLSKVEIIDLYRYVDVSVSEIYRFLAEHAPWIRPSDTGRSTNCLINDLGIYVHRKREGYHNYALPYSWDVRMGHKTRQQAIDELNDQIDDQAMEAMLAKIGFDETVERSDLAAYVVTDLTEDGIWAHLRRMLPAEMLPNQVVLLDDIPITTNGKVDRSKLPRPKSGVRRPAEFVDPSTPTENLLASIFSEVLGMPKVGLYDDFFDLGGDSLAAVKIAIAANEVHLALPANAVFEHRNLATLAAYADQLDTAAAETNAPLLELDEADLANISDLLN